MVVFRRLGNRLANHRASLSSELGSLWDFIRIDRDRRRSAPSASTYETIHTDTRSPVRLARDLLQVIQETVFSKKYEDSPRRCPLVKEESGLSSDGEEGTERRIANLIDFFFTIVKSQRGERKNSTGSCFKSEVTPDESTKLFVPSRMNTELEAKMETLMDFLATTGCMEKENEVGDNKITLMEFLFGPEDPKPSIEIIEADIGLNEANINVKDLSYIDDTPEEEAETLVEMLIKYMENYTTKEKFHSKSLTPSLSEKSKSDITISKLETFSDISKTKSDSTLTHTQDTVIDRGEDFSTDRRISETVIDLSNVKNDLEMVFDEAVTRVAEIKKLEDDTMTEAEDSENYESYTKPPMLPYIQYLPYSVELSDIIEEDEPSSRDLDRKYSDDRNSQIRAAAEDLVNYIEYKVAKHFDEDSDDEFDISPSLKRSSISLIDLRNIPDLPPSMIIKPKVIKVDKSTSTTEISDSLSDMSKRVDSVCMTEDTTLSSSSEKSARALDKLESLHKFFSRSRLEIIDESEEQLDKLKSPKPKTSESDSNEHDYKAGQASLDDVEDIQDDERANVACGDGVIERSIDKDIEIAKTSEDRSESVKEVCGKMSKSLDEIQDISDDDDDSQVIDSDRDMKKWSPSPEEIQEIREQYRLAVSAEASKNQTESEDIVTKIDNAVVEMHGNQLQTVLSEFGETGEEAEVANKGKVRHTSV